MIFSPVIIPTTSQSPIYIYGQFFKFSSLHRELVGGIDIFTPAPNIKMFSLNHHFRANGSRMGDIIPLSEVREVVELVPQFGSKMDINLNSVNSLELADSFYMNHFADKETFHVILSYQ
jgi:hypothetical protein